MSCARYFCDPGTDHLQLILSVGWLGEILKIFKNFKKGFVKFQIAAAILVWEISCSTKILFCNLYSVATFFGAVNLEINIQIETFQQERSFLEIEMKLTASSFATLNFLFILLGFRMKALHSSWLTDFNMNLIMFFCDWGLQAKKSIWP